MPSTASWRRRIATAYSDEGTIAFDLMSQLSHLAAVAASGAARDTIIELAGRQPLRTAAAFRHVFLLVKRLGLEYARAFQVVAAATPTETFKHLLLRFSGAAASGGAEADFIRGEMRVEMERFTAHYERSIEALRKWTEAYTSLLVSASLIVVVAMVSTMLYNIDGRFLSILAGLTVAVVFIGVYVIYRVAPVEQVTTDRGGGEARRRARLALLVGGPLGLAAAGLLLQRAGPATGPGAALLAIGLGLAPSGFFAARDAQAVAAFDRDLPATIRGVGNLAGSLAVSPGIALERVDRRALGSLDAPVRRLQTRLALQLDSELSWERFSLETGSELVRRTVRAFLDAVTLGAPAQLAGETCADFALTVSLLRAKRHLTAATFSYLAVVLHGAMVALLAFVLQLVVLFNARISALVSEMTIRPQAPGMDALAGLPFFVGKDTTPLAIMTYAIVLVLTLANAVAPKAAAGGHAFGVLSYAAATFALSGATLLVVPLLTKGLFKI